MKVISGIYKGREIIGYDLIGTRPTTSRVKESLFSMLQEYLIDSTILDLFSGSGNLAIESLSNGAKEAYVVDSNIKAIKTINTNIKNIKVKNCKVIKDDYRNILKKFGEEDKQFNIIFLDPPYNTNYIEISIKLITDYNLLKTAGIIVCETNNIEKIIYPSSLKIIKNKKYNDKYIVILQKI